MRWLTRQPGLAITTIAVVLGLFEIPFAALMADDLIQVGALEGVTPTTWTGPLELYTISDGVPEHVQAMKDAGAFAWFFDPAFKMAFFRPLSSALLTLDHAVAGLSPYWYRAHGVLWFLLVVIAWGALLRRVLPGRLGHLALLIFVLSGVHGILVWTATRHIVIAAALGVLALLCHVAWREQRWKPGAVLSVAGFALSLAAGEVAMAMVGYLIAYELLGAQGHWRRRLLASAPVGLLVATYLVLYQLLDLGVSGGSGYLDPFHAPITFLLHFPGRLAVLLGAMLAGGHADLWVLRPDLRAAMMVSGGVLVFLALVLLRAVWPRASSSQDILPHWDSADNNRVGASHDKIRHLRWLLAGAVVSTIPFAGSVIGARCLVVPLLGGSVVIAFILHRWWSWLRHQPGLANRLLGALCVGLALIHLGLAPVQRLVAPGLYRSMMYSTLATVMQSDVLDRDRIEGKTLILLNPPNLVGGLHAFFFRRLYRLPMPDRWRALSWAPCDHRFLRSSIDTLEMGTIGGEIEAAHFEAGDQVEISGMRATVLERGDRGPTRVAFQFDRSLDDPSISLLVWRDGRLQRLEPPPVGSSILLTRGAP